MATKEGSLRGYDTVLDMCGGEITQSILEGVRRAYGPAEAGIPVLAKALVRILFDTGKQEDPIGASGPSGKDGGSKILDIRNLIAAEGDRADHGEDLRTDEPAGSAVLAIGGVLEAGIADFVAENAYGIAVAVAIAVPELMPGQADDPAATLADLMRIALFDTRTFPNPLLRGDDPRCPEAGIHEAAGTYADVPADMKPFASRKLWRNAVMATPADLIRNAILTLDPKDDQKILLRADIEIRGECPFGIECPAECPEECPGKCRDGRGPRQEEADRPGTRGWASTYAASDAPSHAP